MQMNWILFLVNSAFVLVCFFCSDVFQTGVNYTFNVLSRFWSFKLVINKYKNDIKLGQWLSVNET